MSQVFTPRMSPVIVFVYVFYGHRKHPLNTQEENVTMDIATVIFFSGDCSAFRHVFTSRARGKDKTIILVWDITILSLKMVSFSSSHKSKGFVYILMAVFSFLVKF